MRVDGSGLTLSATDLATFLACRHRTALEMAVAVGARKRPHVEDPLLELLWERGAAHEKRYVDRLTASGQTLVDLSTIEPSSARISATIDAMRQGADVIVQAALADGRWFGKPDVMLRVERPSALGGWSYEIADTKLAQETRAGTILQLSLYSEMLAAAQQLRPERFYVVTPDTIESPLTYRVDDYAAYFRLVRDQLLATVAREWTAVATDNYPEPVDHCDICLWHPSCREKRRGDDHLSLVANISRTQRRELEARSITTLTRLAGLETPLPFKPRRGSAESYASVRDQARLQVTSRGKTPPLYEPLPIEAGKGLCRLPEPSPGDLFLDLEGDEFATDDGGREYLFGLASVDGSYRATWAFTDHEERDAFEWAMDAIADAAEKHPGMHVYHYAAYEVTAFKRLMGKYVTRGRELDAMLREGRFVDLFPTVRQGLRAGIERYSIKNLEALYAFDRSVPLARANESLRIMALGLETGRPTDVDAGVRAVVEGYNRDDCVSTLRLRNWLESVRATVVASGTEVPRATLGVADAPGDVGERAQRVDQLRARLLSGVPEEHERRDAEQQARWVLAYMLDYHRREDRATWWDYFRLCDLAPENLFDEREAVAGLEFVERCSEVKNKRTGKPTGSVVERYRYPAQEMEIERGDVWLQDKNRFGEVVRVDRTQRTIDVKKRPEYADLHPTAIFAFKYVSPETMEDSIFRIGEAVAAGGSAHRLARELLERVPPRLESGVFAKRESETEMDFAVRIANDLDETVIAIQGPPGSGKTFGGARMICELVRQGKKVGVTANSHSVIDKMLEAVDKEAKAQSLKVRLAHKYGEGEDADPDSPIACIASNDAVRAALLDGSANVVGGTAWLWANEKLAQSVDVLFVDEAGQMSLANVLAISPAGWSLVLLGDPQQLEQPRKGTHPDGVAVSALEHVLRGDRTIPADRGIFLPVTWRLAPRICAFTSELFYDGRLESREAAGRQRVAGARGLPESGLVFVTVDHDGNKNFSIEEIDAVEDLVARLIAPGATWRDADGVERQMTGADVLVVAPYNAHVARLSERLENTGVRVGTVDKFQGQEAPVVIYSMATSRPEDAPRGMEFLYSLNRLNVATSRAKCLVIVVASARLLEPECKTPRQMKLANGLCRFRELAVTSNEAV